MYESDPDPESGSNVGPADAGGKKRDPNDPSENRGHTVNIDLTCCSLLAALPERAQELRAWGAPPDVVGFYGRK